MKKQYKSSIIKNHKITKTKLCYLKRLSSLLRYFLDFAPEVKETLSECLVTGT